MKKAIVITIGVIGLLLPFISVAIELYGGKYRVTHYFTYLGVLAVTTTLLLMVLKTYLSPYVAGFWVLLKRIDGTEVFCEVLWSDGYNDGYAHTYKLDGKLQTCYEPRKVNFTVGYDATGKPLYHPIAIPGWYRLTHKYHNAIPQQEGNVMACRYNTWGMPDPDAPGEEHALLVREHEQANMAKKIVGIAQIPWAIIALTFVAILLLVGAYMLIKPEAPVIIPSGNGTTIYQDGKVVTIPNENAPQGVR